MSNNITHIDSRRIQDYDDRFAQTAVPATGVETVVLSFRTKVGFAGELVRWAMAWDAAMDTFVTLSLYVDGARVPLYDATTVQLSPPESDADLPVPIKLPQSAFIEVRAASSVAGNVTSRVRALYYDQNQ